MNNIILMLFSTTLLINVSCIRQYLVVKTSFYLVDKETMEPVGNNRIHYAFLEDKDTVKTGIITTDSSGYGKTDKCFFTYRPFFMKPKQKILLSDINGKFLGADIDGDTIYVSVQH